MTATVVNCNVFQYVVSPAGNFSEVTTHRLQKANGSKEREQCRQQWGQQSHWSHASVWVFNINSFQWDWVSN